MSGLQASRRSSPNTYTPRQCSDAMGLNEFWNRIYRRANHSFLPTSPPHNSESSVLLLALGEDEGALVLIYSTNTCYVIKHTFKTNICSIYLSFISFLCPHSILSQ